MRRDLLTRISGVPATIPRDKMGTQNSLLSGTAPRDATRVRPVYNYRRRRVAAIPRAEGMYVRVVCGPFRPSWK